MKIAVYTGGQEDRASSRLRSHYVFNHIVHKDIKIFRNLHFLKFAKSDVFHFHMLFKPMYIIKAIILRIFGKIVIFDIDDNPKKFKHKLGFYFMANCATLVFFDTRFRLNHHKKFFFNKKKIHQISDVLDLHPLKKKSATKKTYTINNKFIWFGNIENSHLINNFYDFIVRNKKLFLYMVSSYKKKSNKKNIFFIKWKKDLIFNLGRKIDISILSHDGGKDDLCKSENKMVLSILAGIIPIVSNTPSYSSLAKKLNAKKLIYKNTDEILKIARKLSPEWKKRFIKSARKYLMVKYSSQIIFNNILKKIYLIKKNER